MVWILLILIAVSAGLHIRAEYKGIPQQVYLFKPLTMAFVISLALVHPLNTSQTYRILIVLGLLFSLAGDVFLMLPKDSFLQGLVSFLIAHLFYIAAFCQGSQFTEFMSYLPFIAYGGVMYKILYPSLGKFKIPVVVYMLVIVSMGCSALSHWIPLHNLPSFLGFIGSVLFIASDSILAVNKFKEPFHHAQFWILLTYFSAQALIALSV